MEPKSTSTTNPARIPAKKRVDLRIVGRGFKPGVLYTAWLLVDGCDAQVWEQINILAKWPVQPLTDWIVKEHEAGWRGDTSLDVCLPVQAKLTATPPYFLSKPIKVGSDEWPLPAGSMSIEITTECPDGVTLKLGRLQPHRYRSSVVVGDQLVDVSVIVRRPLWMVFLLVFLGGLLSIIARAFLVHTHKARANQRMIADVGAELDDRTHAFIWDEVRAGNAVRSASASRDIGNSRGSIF